MSSYRVEFTLKQHTPLIHFQHDQAGATLRATELKPKLDRFLLEKEPGLPSKEHHGGRRSLDYKMRLEYMGVNAKDYPKAFVRKGTNGYQAPYFADGISIDQGGETKLYFSVFDEAVRRALKKYVPEFFALQNFGARQSKGFGSYQDKSVNVRDFEALLLKHSNSVYKFNTRAANPKEALKIIDLFYREMKAGTNQPIYEKSMLFKYMCSKNSGWEKRWLKEKFSEIVYGEHKPVDCSPRSEYRFIRALLGLAEHNEYYPYGQKEKLQIKIVGTRKESVDGKKEKPKSIIQRFRSPITFKVFENNIYLLHDKSYEKLYGESFTFSLKGESYDLKVPDQFDLDGFLAFAAKVSDKITKLQGGQK